MICLFRLLLQMNHTSWKMPKQKEQLLPFPYYRSSSFLFIKKWSACILSVFRGESWSMSSYPMVIQWKYYFSEKIKHLTAISLQQPVYGTWGHLLILLSVKLHPSKQKVNGYITCEKRHTPISLVHHPEMYQYIYWDTIHSREFHTSSSRKKF